MFGFRTRAGYHTINNDIVLPQTFEAISASVPEQSEDSSLLPALSSTTEELDGRDIFSGPPLEHNVAHERGEVIGSHSIVGKNLRWDRVDNLDQFFTRVYEYHQNGGFFCICLKNILSLFQFIFVVCFAFFLIECVDYNVLFNNQNFTSEDIAIKGKRRISDVILNNWMNNVSISILVILLFAILFWLLRATRVFYQILQFYEIHNFYQSALGISDLSLNNLTWPEVVQRVCDRQPSIHLIISKDGITAFDIYQRILRYKNYFIALVNKNVLPPVLNVPFIGQLPYLPNGLKMNLEWLLFYGQWSPWKGPYELREEYKHKQNIFRLADEMESAILLMGIGNLVFFPLIFLYQILYSFFSYGELMKREPGAFGIRRYSNYGRSKLRHFNELDHELRLRLSRSHRAATRYMEQFTSPVSQIIGKNIQFVASSFLGVLIILAAWDEDVLSVDHVLTAITVCGVIVVVCRSLIADENMVWWPEYLLNIVISQIHYAPDSWKDKAHTDAVRRDFGQFFQLKAQFLLEEMLSPILTPFILLRCIKPRAKELVDFFHNFTISVDGLGDVCSFAQMDVARHGDPKWGFDAHSDASSNNLRASTDYNVAHTKVSANDGKTELSLLNFANNHPDWNPPHSSSHFLNGLRNRMEHDFASLKEGELEKNVLYDSLQGLKSSTYRKCSRITKVAEPFTSSLREIDFFNLPCKSPNSDLEMTEEPDKSLAISITYMRNLRAHRVGQTTATNLPLFAPSSSGQHEHLDGVWDVPAQSVIGAPPHSSAEVIKLDSHFEVESEVKNAPPLSDHILDI